MTKLPINLTDLLRQRIVEGERIEYKNRLVSGRGHPHGQPVFPPVGLADHPLDKIQQVLLTAVCAS